MSGDRVRLVQILDNLVGNSVKFTPPQGTVSVRLVAQPDIAVLQVQDTGLGLAPELLSRLFQPFEQGAQDGARAAGGLGLGLAVVRGLVELHEGTIDARSDGDMDGYEVARAIRADESFRDIVLVALTGYGHPDARTRMHEAGFDESMTKPVGLEEIETVMNRLLEPRS